MNKIDFLFNKISSLVNVGEKISSKVEKLTQGDQIIDLLFLRPSNLKSRRFLENHLSAFDKELITTKLVVDDHEKPYNNSSPFKVRCSNDFGSLTLVFFKVFPNYIEKNFAIGSKIAVSGKVEFFNNQAQISHPDFVFKENLIENIPSIEVIYPLTAGLNLKILRKTIFEALDKVPDLKEWSDQNFIDQSKFPSWKNALKNIHYPKELEDLEPTNLNLKRLAFDELLASSFANLIAKQNNQESKGRTNKAQGVLVEKLIKKLPFTLTDGQKSVLDDVFSDMKSNKKMLRLLQGDVGSGKTIIAFLAAILTKEDEKQSAIIVPISLLANQHFEVLQNLVQDLSKELEIKLALLTSRTKKSEKKKILKELAAGEIDIIIGTHALIYEDVIFKDLSLIVIDEQHRFGVLQRLELVKKGIAPDVLLMSATPIPRSLMMTLYGDMDISLLMQKPKNRVEIDTRIKSLAKVGDVYDGLKRAIEKGEKIYWICPLIEESEELGFSNVLEKYDLFKKMFGENKVALIHGKLKGKEKDEIMTKFAQSDPSNESEDNENDLQILIATTVIEVGIDVKDATIIIIENSEKFGLSQLHQLRGRVGRSDKQSYCLLLYSNNIGVNSKKRLEVMRNCFDGFKVAEEDLKMRGSGQIFGTRQSGLPEYKFANLIFHQDLLKIANKNARFILSKNPELVGDEGENVKNLLRIFKYDHFIKLIKSG